MLMSNIEFIQAQPQKFRSCVASYSMSNYRANSKNKRTHYANEYPKIIDFLNTDQW